MTPIFVENINHVDGKYHSKENMFVLSLQQMLHCKNGIGCAEFDRADESMNLKS